MRKVSFLVSMMFLSIASTSYSENLLTIGTLRTTEHLITIHHAENGTVYTVKTHDGKLLEQKINEKDLISKMPYLEDILKRGVADDAGTSRRYMRENGLGGKKAWHEGNDY